MNKIRFTMICWWEFIANQGIISVTSGGSGRRDAILRGRTCYREGCRKFFVLILSLI